MLPKQDFSGARDWVREQASEGDRIVALDLAADAYGRHYAPEFGQADTLAELEALRASDGRTWIVYTFGGYIEAREPDLWQVVTIEFEEVAAFPGTLGGGAIVVCRSR